MNFTEQARRLNYSLQRRTIRQPLRSIALALCVLFALAACIEYSREKLLLDREATKLSEALNEENREARQISLRTSTSEILEKFRPTQLARIIYSAGKKSRLQLTEIQYSLEDTANKPFLRYRAVLTVSSNYPVIRSYINAVKSELKNVSLDSITCSRGDIGTDELTCDVALSVFYGKGRSG